MTVRRVLVIDDDREIVATLTDSLTDSGYSVIGALHGGDGLMLLEAEPPGVVLLDIKMPGMSGLEVLQRIRAQHPALPVIVITGFLDQEVAQQALQRGAFDLLSKPIDLARLERCVALALAGPSAAH